MKGFTYDSGALIAAERHDRRMWQIHQRALMRKEAPTVPAVVLAEVYRGKQPNLERFLDGCKIEPMTEVLARTAGLTLGRSKMVVGAVDAAVVEGALRRGDLVVTSDPKHIEALAAALGRKIGIVPL
jgi:predicted nucleic acid-binding protein